MVFGDNFSEGLGQVMLPGKFDAVRDMVLDLLGTGQRVELIVQGRSIVILGEDCGFLQFADIVVKGRGLAKQGPGADFSRGFF